MSTATDLGTFGFTLVGYGTAGTQSTDITQNPDGVQTSTNRRINRNFDFQSEYGMLGTTTLTGMLGTGGSMLGGMVLGTRPMPVTWNSFSDPSNDGPPTPLPLINVSAVRIK